MIRLAALLLLIAASAATPLPSPARGEGAPPAAEAPIPSLYADPVPFLAAIERERPPAGSGRLAVTGIAVPHHLLAADLLARGFWAAEGGGYRRVVILSPDHFQRSRKPFATTLRDIDTVLGPLATDREAVGALLAESDLFETSDLFDREHGIAALLPFVKHFFPDSVIVPMAISIRADRQDWDRAAALVARLAGPGTLVVQSTDYSHYLSAGASLARDQETLHVIAAGDADAVDRLVSSDHMDSRAAQSIQMRVQAGLGSRATVIASRNSIEYVPHASRTTSYLVTVYSPEVAAYPVRFPDQDVVVFGGDVFPGRWLTKPLADPRIREALAARLRALTGGAPLVANLEAVLLPDLPEGLSDRLHGAHAGLALPVLKSLGITAAGLANNHSFDLGRDGFRETVAALAGAGIRPLRQGEVADLGPVRVVALNFVGRNDRAGFPVVRPSDLDGLCRDPARPPLVAFVHWGREYEDGIGPEEERAARELHRCGITAVIGAHSHRASDRIEQRQGGEYALLASLGNLLFDQTAPRGSGTLLELRRFRQGTVAMRLLPVPNLFDLANALLREGADAPTGSRTGPSSGSDGNR